MLPYNPRPNIGIFANEDEALRGLVRRLADWLDPQAIWLFGSRARGDHRPDSDFDFMVVAKPGAAWGNDDYDVVCKPTRDTRVNCDVVPCDAEHFEVGLQLNTSFVTRIVGEGRETYHT